MNHWPRTLIALVCLFGVGCALDNSTREHARINDRVGGFEITAVDGKPPTRWHHSVHTVVPVVLVEPGTHTFATERDGDEVVITATVEAGKYYQTSKTSGDFSITEKNGEANVGQGSETQ